MSNVSDNKYPTVTKLLKEYVNDDNFAQGVDPFYLAIRAFEIETAKFWFKESGADFERNKEYLFGQSILYLAVQDGNLDVIQLLIEQLKFDINHIPKHGYSILGNALENASDQVVRYLLNIPNIKYNIHDKVAPFYRPLDKVIKQQDLLRTFALLFAMLKDNIFLSPRDLEILQDKIADKDNLQRLLQNYMVNLKHQLKIYSAECILNPSYTARELLAYLELWNLQSRIEGLDSSKLSFKSAHYSGIDAVKFVINELLPVIGFGFLPPEKLVTAYKTIKSLEIFYKLPSNMELNLKLDEELSKAIDKYTQQLDWEHLQKFTVADLQMLQHNLAQFEILADFLHQQPRKSFIANNINAFKEHLSSILEIRLTGIMAPTLQAKFSKLANSMNDSRFANQTLGNFIEELDNKKLPKATLAFLISNLDTEHNSHSTPNDNLEQKNVKKDLFDWFD